MILGWATANPAAVAAYAERLPPSEDRAQAMSQALPQWVSRDPIAASEWMINHYDPSPDSDAGVAAVVMMPPAYINVGAYVDSNTMIDSHALIGSCAQIGKMKGGASPQNPPPAQADQQDRPGHC